MVGVDLKAGGDVSFLVVEDDPALGQLYLRQLVPVAAHVDLADTGEKALDFLKRRRYDVVLTDLSLPGQVDGTGVVRRLKSDWPDSDVIVITGSPTLDTAIRTLKDGASDYISKPFTHEQLKIIVDRTLANRRIRKELDREKSLRAELQAAYAELQKAHGLQDAFMARVSHELRTPLAVASGRLGLLESKLEGADKENLSRALKAIGQLDQVVADLLTFSELLKDDAKFESAPVDVAALLRELLAEYALLFQKKEAEVRLELPAGLPKAKGDPGLLRQALRHLVVNAALFNKLGGFARFSAKAKAGWLHLEFENSGAEVPPDQAERIFDSFYQVAEAMTREVGGLGLGLAIVRRIVQNHGGTVRVIPRPEGGALFFMDLPAA